MNTNFQSSYLTPEEKQERAKIVEELGEQKILELKNLLPFVNLSSAELKHYDTPTGENYAKKQKEIAKGLQSELKKIERLNSIDLKVRQSWLKEEALFFAGPMDWICLAQNRYFDAWFRKKFLETAIQKVNSHELAGVYEAFYKTQNLTEDEILDVMRFIDSPGWPDVKEELYTEEMALQDIEDYDEYVDKEYSEPTLPEKEQGPYTGFFKICLDQNCSRIRSSRHDYFCLDN